MSRFNDAFLNDDVPRHHYNFTKVYLDLIQSHGLYAAAVHGVILRYASLQKHVCCASKATMAEKLGCSPRTVIRYTQQLIADGLIVDTTPDLERTPHEYAVLAKGQRNSRSGDANLYLLDAATQEIGLVPATVYGAFKLAATLRKRENNLFTVSITEIAEMCGLSRRATINHLNNLVEGGRLQIIKRKGRTSVYKLNYEWLEEHRITEVEIGYDV